MICTDEGQTVSEYINENLDEKRKRLQKLIDQIEDRNLSNLADMAEIRYLQWEVAGLLEEFKMDRVQKHNAQLSVWAHNSPAAEDADPGQS